MRYVLWKKSLETRLRSRAFTAAASLIFCAGCAVRVTANFSQKTPGSTESVTLTALPGTQVYFQNQSVNITVTTTTTATVTGSPRIALTVGGQPRYAEYVSGTGSSSLTFVYTPAVNDYEGGGTTASASIDLNGGSIVGPSGQDLANSVTITLPASTILIDAIPHTLSFGNPSSSEAVSENSGSQSLSVTLTPAALGDVIIPLSNSGNSTVGVDHDLNSTQVTIPAGSTSVSASYLLLDNSTSQSDRVLQLQLGRPTSASNFALSAQDQYRLLIRDDDPGVESMAQISSGATHSCGVLGSGVLKCWGANNYGKLGIGNTVAKSSPTTVNSGTSYSRVAAGADHSCGIVTGTGALKCWGRNDTGQLGTGNTAIRYTPIVVNSGTAYSFIAAGGGHTCGIVSASSALKCWGSNSSGEVGNGLTTNQLSPTVIDSGVSYESVSLGYRHTCGIVSGTGALKCWGDNYFGELGDGTTNNSSLPIVIDSGVAYSQVAAGQYYTCGIVSGTGTLKCWGQNTYSQLGNGTTSDILSPTIIDSGVSYSNVIVSTASTFTLGTTCGIVSTTGALKCWGYNDSGQIGDGSITLLSPTPIDAQVSYSQIALGKAHACGIVSGTGSLKCWGDKSSGQLGDGTTSTYLSPTVTHSDVAYSQISARESQVCGIVNGTGALRCWGENTKGQLGDGTSIRRYGPVLIDPGISYDQVATAYDHSCGIVSVTGALKCWGANTQGQIGDGTNTDRNIPTPVDLGTAYLAVTTGYQFTCGIVKNSGALKCWGLNGSGELGDGTTNNKNIPTTIDPSVAYAQVAGGNGFACAIVRDTGALKCWGRDDNNQLGDGNTTIQYSPILIDAGVAYSKIAAGAMHACGLVAGTGDLKCWGYNINGQIGDGTTNQAVTPTLIDSGVAYSAISLGAYHSCAMSTAGDLKCWGRGNEGQVGDGSLSWHDTPYLIASGMTNSQLVSGSYFSCVTVSGAGGLRCWGTNSSGQLGAGFLRTTAPESIPLK